MLDYDILIVGAGLNGASLAYALALYNQGLRIGLIEARMLSISSGVQTPYDARSIALAYGSRLIYQYLGLWEDMAPHATAIHSVHISERGHFGSLDFNKTELGIDALGYVIPAVVLQNILNNALYNISKKGGLDLIYPAQVTAVHRSADKVTVEYKKEGIFQASAKLLIAADGANSIVRRLSGIPVITEDYEQAAIITNINLARNHWGVAYERFTKEGILAMLPLSNQRCTLIWTVQKSQLNYLLELSDQDFLKSIQQLFGYRLGRLESLAKRNAVPLQKIQSLDPVQKRLVLVGNAAHSLHPVAAQGLNLGLRDMAVLLEIILDAHKNKQDIGSMEILKSYMARRGSDQDQIMGFIDGLIKLFGKQSSVLGALRGFGLQFLDINPLAKYYLARLAMGTGGGIAGQASKLASGIFLI